ncbi:hypothetical protein BH10ACI1_BH10ACI1_29360 [soil metagenome]
MSLRILRNGILTTIQDLGRNSFRRFGINPNGAMDTSAVRLINILLGNNENEAVLEMHFPAPEILFEKAAVFAIGGADFLPELNGQTLENWRLHFAEKGSILKLGKRVFGNRAYLAIKGGFKIKEVFNSKSTNLSANFGGFEGRKLQNGDCLDFNQKPKIKAQRSKIKLS